MLANHGRIDKYVHEFEGVNSRLDALQAAVLRVKLKHLAEWTRARREIAAAYRRLLSASPARLPDDPEEATHVYHLFVIRVEARDRVRQLLQDRGVTCGIHYPIALPNLPAYAGKGQGKGCPVASRNQELVLSLPLFPEMTMDMVQYVAECLGDAL